jgi:anti-sigma factor RsiW
VQKFSIFGCAKRHWQGRPLSIVCFAFPGGREVHLVTVDRIHIPNPPPERVPAFGKIGDYQTASWSEGELAMMLIGKIDRTELQRLFTQTAAVTPGLRQRIPFAFAILR